MIDRGRLMSMNSSVELDLDSSKCVSVIIPAYNLEHVIMKTISKVKNTLDSLGYRYEIIIVDDGSTDNTYDRVKGMVGNHDNGIVRVYKLTRNRGKGFALLYGFLKSKCESIVFFDGDLDIPVFQIPVLLKALEHPDVDVVVTSKWHSLSRTIAIPTRMILSKVFSILVKVLLGIRIKDTQTGAKALRRRVLEVVMPKLLVKRYAFDAELLAAAQANGFNIVEVPSVYPIKLTSKFKPKEIFHMLLDLLATSYRLKIRKWYTRPSPTSYLKGYQLILFSRHLEDNSTISLNRLTPPYKDIRLHDLRHH